MKADLFSSFLHSLTLKISEKYVGLNHQIDGRVVISETAFSVPIINSK